MNENIYDIFFELMQLSLGNREELKHQPTEDEWMALLDIADRQKLIGVLYPGVESAFKDYVGFKPDVLYEWYSIKQKIVDVNSLLNRRVKQLADVLSEEGIKSCVLKGQGTALYYDKPELRQCGDIDMWVEGDRDDILAFARSKGFLVNNIESKHIEIEVFKDVSVELHYKPSLLYNPFANKKLQRFFKEKADKQFRNFDDRAGFVHTTIDFDLVFSMVHIYRHVFSVGIGLRQLMDYYYILKNSTDEQRKAAYEVLKSLRMKTFAGGMMWILHSQMGLDKTFLLCEPNIKCGKFQLNEILRSGNFGEYDERFKNIDNNNRFIRGLVKIKRNLSYLPFYPAEVLWAPMWMLWHYCWRKQKGYL